VSSGASGVRIAIPMVMTESASSETEAMANAQERLETAITELQGLQELLLSGDIPPLILGDFRDALNRVRNTAWAAQQYVARKENDQDSTTVLSFLAGERVRAAHHLCQAISDDLRRPGIEIQPGSVIQLHIAAKALKEQLDDVVSHLG
jgi:hypothetical protein